MLIEAKICSLCVHMHEEWRTDGRHRWVRTCDLGIKKIGRERFEDFTCCKEFEPSADAIDRRADEIGKTLRAIGVELSSLERLAAYATHKRRRGAEYHPENCWYKPMIRETEEKTARACGFEDDAKEGLSE